MNTRNVAVAPKFMMDRPQSPLRTQFVGREATPSAGHQGGPAPKDQQRTVRNIRKLKQKVANAASEKNSFTTATNNSRSNLTPLKTKMKHEHKIINNIVVPSTKGHSLASSSDYLPNNPVPKTAKAASK